MERSRMVGEGLFDMMTSEQREVSLTDIGSLQGQRGWGRNKPGMLKG